jgi:hypothetical protein
MGRRLWIPEFSPANENEELTQRDTEKAQWFTELRRDEETFESDLWYLWI